MAIYLIDYENTKNLQGVNNLTAEDCVVIFYSSQANSLSFDAHKEITYSKATFEYKFVDVGGQNALDFQLSSYLGYIIKQNESSNPKIYIISKDKGFNYVESFWKNEKSIDIQILSSLNVKEKNTVTENSNTPLDIESLLRQSEEQLSENEISEIMAIIEKYKTIQTINGYLNKLLKDSTKAGTILKIIRPFIKK